MDRAALSLNDIPPTLAEEEFWRLLGRVEHEQLDFKRGVSTNIRGAAVQLVRRVGAGAGPGPATAREQCSAPLTATVDCCLRFITDHTRHVEAVTGSRRETLPEYPRAVLREAIVNALAHRDCVPSTTAAIPASCGF